MIMNKVKGSFRVELQTGFIRGDAVRISIPSVFDHENVAFQIMIHLNRIW